ncbi:MAG: copper resistance protein NlpE [Gammaproteobacteria bacterium]|nr:copper resistance protein NlpE [Gammaproteobacteria bacterium]
MKTFRKTITSIAVLILIMSINLVYKPVLAEEAEGQEAPKSPAHLNLSGLYLGFYPCDDCKGIRTTLALNKNETYMYTSLYAGKSEREFVEKGKYSVVDNTLVLTPRKGSTTVQKYLIEDDLLIKLDEEGKRITKDGADGYILHRKDVIKDSGNHSGH